MGDGLSVLSDGDTVLVFHLRQVGDLVFSLPLLHACRQALPSGRVVSVLSRELQPLLRTSPFVDEVITRYGDSMASLAWQLRRHRPAVALGLSQSTATGLLMLACGARRRVGFADSDLRWGLSDVVPLQGTPNPAKMAAVATALGLAVPHPSYQGLLSLAAEARNQAAAVLEAEGAPPAGAVLMGIGVSERRSFKAWPVERFSQVARQLACESPVVLVGNQAERATAEGLAAELPGVFSIAGKTPLDVLAAVMAGARLYIGSDSGPLHLAAAMGTPVVALYGPTDPARTGPHGQGHIVLNRRLECAPCQRGCESRRCMAGITVEEVLAAAGKLLCGRDRLVTV